MNVGFTVVNPQVTYLALKLSNYFCGQKFDQQVFN